MFKLKRPLWEYWWSSFFTPSVWRAAKCMEAGTHNPVHIEGGTRKLCFNCGAW